MDNERFTLERERTDGWISVKDFLPIDLWNTDMPIAMHDVQGSVVGTYIVYYGLAKDPHDRVVGIAEYNSRDGWCYFTGEPLTYWAPYISHWQSLPESPKE